MSDINEKINPFLRLIYNAFQKGIITKDDKIKLKEHVIIKEPKIVKFLEDYDEKDDENYNLNSLKNFVQNMLNTSVVLPEGMSSPEEMTRIKIKRFNENQEKQEMDEEESTAVFSCKEGLSPQLYYR